MGHTKGKIIFLKINKNKNKNKKVKNKLILKSTKSNYVK